MTDCKDHKELVEYPLSPQRHVTHISFARENMIAKARIQKLQQELEWFARGKFIGDGQSGQEMAWLIIRRARGAIKYLADE
jgi:hypothetical protein